MRVAKITYPRGTSSANFLHPLPFASKEDGTGWLPSIGARVIFPGMFYFLPFSNDGGTNYYPRPAACARRCEARSCSWGNAPVPEETLQAHLSQTFAIAMNRLSLLVLGILLTFASAWMGLIVYPFFALNTMQPLTDPDTGEALPPGLPGLAVAGQRVYAASGCVYCHSQQVRPFPLSTDIEKGLGARHTVARDYLRAQPVFLGTMRTGPDLANVGIRQPDAAWHHRHLFEPQAVTGWSIMPSFRYLYQVRPIQGQLSEEAVTGLSGPHAPPEGFEVLPSEDAKALVAYLLSLQRASSLPESPKSPLRK